MTQTAFRFDPTAPRLSGNRAAIIERLKQGPATNGELSQVGGLRFGARLAELRAASFDIRIVENDRESGRVVYQLFGSDEA